MFLEIIYDRHKIAASFLSYKLNNANNYVYVGMQTCCADDKNM